MGCSLAELCHRKLCPLVGHRVQRPQAQPFAGIRHENKRVWGEVKESLLKEEGVEYAPEWLEELQQIEFGRAVCHISGLVLA